MIIYFDMSIQTALEVSCFPSDGTGKEVIGLVQREVGCITDSFQIKDAAGEHIYSLAVEECMCCCHTGTYMVRIIKHP